MSKMGAGCRLCCLASIFIIFLLCLGGFVAYLRTIKPYEQAEGTRILLFGGQNSPHTVEQYFPNVPSKNGFLQTKSPLPMIGTVGGYIDGKILIVGGQDEKGHAHKSTLIFDPRTEAWAQLPPLKSPRTFACGAVLRNRFYVCGGFDGTFPVGTCETYTPGSKTWIQSPSMDDPRFRAGCAVLDDKLYMIGGRREYAISSVERFDAETQRWQQVYPLPERADGVKATVFQSNLIACGGVNGLCWKYQPKYDEWKSFASLSSDKKSFSLVNFNNNLYVLGGSGGEMVEQYEGGKWKKLLYMNLMRKRDNAVSIVI